MKKKADSLQTEISEQSLPRRRKAPKRFEIGDGDPYFPSTESEHYIVQYFEAIDLTVSAIDGRFNQPGFKGYKTMEQFLVKSLLHSDFLKVAEEYHYIKENYSQDLNAYLLKSQLAHFREMFQDENCSCFKDIYAKLQELDPAELNLISEVIKVVK